MAWTALEEAAMRQALDLARRGAGLVEPNPMVGAVVVAADGSTVVGTGWHERFGGPHAEVTALAAAGAAARGATLFVTLEPCPMCAGAILNSRVTRLVFGAADPKAGSTGTLYNLMSDPRLNHEVDVEHGCRAQESRDLLMEFFAHKR